jgi:mono/diheme cytochrome c family protein
MSTRWPVYLALGLLVFFSVAFLTLFAITSFEAPDAENASTEAAIDPTQAAALLAAGDPARGAQLVVEYGCTGCHMAAAGVGIAPPYAGLAERAANRIPSLTAAEYIYQSIVSPRAFVVPDYAESMPLDFRTRLSDAQIGDIMAYLLSGQAG